MPAGLAEEFRRAAEAMADAISTTLPAGSQVNLASEARGTNPFLEFVTHQQKLIVLLATGGTLTSLAESGTGTLAGNAQMDVWEQIVRRDAEIIGAAIHERVALPYLREHFPGRPVVAEFALGRDAEPTPEEMFDLAAKAVAAGYRMAQPDLEEATGYALEGLQTPSEGGLPPFTGGASAGYGDFGVAKPLQNAWSAPHDKIPVRNARTPLRGDFGHDAAIRALATDMEPIADRLRAILAQPEETWADAFAALAEEMPELLQNSDALAELMEEEMARAIANSMGSDESNQHPFLIVEGPGRKILRNSNGDHCDKCGAFTTKDNLCVKCRGDSTQQDREKAIQDEIDALPSVPYSAANYNSVGNKGSWQKLNLPSMEKIKPDAPIVFDKNVDMEAIRARLEKGEQVTSPLNETLTFKGKPTKIRMKSG